MIKPEFDVDPKAKTEQPHAGWSRPRTLAERREMIGLPPMEESSGLGSMSRLAESFEERVVPGGARAQPPADAVVIEEPVEVSYRITDAGRAAFEAINNTWRSVPPNADEPMRPGEWLEDKFNEAISAAIDPSGGVDPGNKYTAESNKLAYDLLPPYGLACVVAALTYGGTKYKRWGWVDQEVTHLALVGACLRHLQAWCAGEEIDADSGLPHFGGAIFSLMALADNTVLHPELDDRCPDKDGRLREAIAKLCKTLETRLPQIRAEKRRKVVQK